MEKIISNLTLLYQGPARVYLQGRNALLVAPPETDNEMRYFIGSEQTNLVVRDFREKTIAEARESIRRQYQNGFAKSFNQDAWIEVRYSETQQGIEVDLHLGQNYLEHSPVLWMGIIENNQMPGYKVEWEVFRAVNSDNTAFVALIP